MKSSELPNTAIVFLLFTIGYPTLLTTLSESSESLKSKLHLGIKEGWIQKESHIPLQASLAVSNAKKPTVRIPFMLATHGDGNSEQ
jgi:hypothetical protein